MAFPAVVVGEWVQMPVYQAIRMWSIAALSATALVLCGCSSIAYITGLEATGAPKSRELSGYLPVHDLPPPRDEPVINPEDQAKIQTDLLATRERQAAAAAANK